MSLLDTARQLNARDEARILAEGKKTSDEAKIARKVDIYRQYGALWFSELTIAIGELVSDFNATTGSHTKLLMSEHDSSEFEKIAVELIAPTNSLINKSSCVLHRSVTELYVSCEVKTSGRTETQHFNVLPTEKFEIEVLVEIENENARTIYCKDEGRKPTGDMLMDFRTVTETVKAKKKLGPHEFSDHILDLFVKRVCYPKR